MVKADPKRDYYADLDLPSTADSETIKKRFRELAKQYHPDRNPGREVDVVPKFQAVQAANEVLGDPNQKAKYDAERAKLAKAAESPVFKRPPPPQPPPPRAPAGFNVPNAQPRKEPSARGSYQGQPPRRPDSASSNNADRWGQFARSAPPPQPQTWDRSRYEEQTRAEALRGMNAMRGGQTPQAPPPRSSRHPTAPKQAGPPPDAPHSAGAGPSPGFPGLGRTPNQRKGFSPVAARGDEPPPTSAYAYVNRHRPTSTDNYQNTPQGHHVRHTKSSGFDDWNPVRPGLSRTSSKYAGHSGERTRVDTTHLHRSASMRSSPVDPRYEEKGPFGASAAPKPQPPPRPRHRSLSPKVRAEGNVKFDFPASDTSSEEAGTTKAEDRPKASPRRPQGPFMANRTMSGDEPALTGQFPNTNYTRVVDDNQYQFPPPEAKGMPARKPFSNMTSPTDTYATMNVDTGSATSADGPYANQPHQDGGNVPPDGNAGFAADEWREKFSNASDFFAPNQSTTKDRRSPTRGARTTRMNSKGLDASQSQEDLPSDVDPIASGMKHMSPEEVQAKAAAFQPGKFSAEDWAERLKSQNDLSRANPKPPKRGSKTSSTRKGAEDEDGHDANAYVSAESSLGADEMDVDEPNANDTNGAAHTAQTTNGEPKSAGSTGGVDLNDLSRTAPFAPSSTGLKGMDELKTNLPFDSRAAHGLGLDRTHSQTLRELQLPRPPRPIGPPGDGHITQASWKQYADSMTAYMHDWNAFNSKMIEHFKTRQESITHGMYRNWVSAQGDGASADDYDRSQGHDKAGYATYMTWLEDDRKCRTWWDLACEEHRQCLENLGKIRQKVKAMSS